MNQLSMDRINPDSIGLAPNAFERLLPELLPSLLSPTELSELHPEPDFGAPTCCPLRLLAMLLLQFRFDLSERELHERCRRDLGFRFALSLQSDEQPPSPRSLRRFRGRLVQLEGDDFLLEVTLRLAREEGFLDDVALQAVDSTNTDCRGAIIDTYNLVAAGIRQLVRVVARCLDRRADDLARQWALGAYMGRGIKGSAAIDWDDESQRNALLTQEIRDADRVAAEVGALAERMTLPTDVQEALELLRRVARQDVEQLEDGSFRIARRTAPGRTISITDPEARHGRKSSARVINGFKTHVLGTIDSQFQ